MNPQEGQIQFKGINIPNQNETAQNGQKSGLNGQLKTPCAEHEGLCIPKDYQAKMYKALEAEGFEIDYQAETEMSNAINHYRQKYGRYPPYCGKCGYFVL